MAVPSAPTNVSATDNLSDRVTITWTTGAGETTGSYVARNGSIISSVISHGTYTYSDTTGTLNQAYSYTVYSRNSDGVSAASSADNGTRYLAVPSAPTSVSATDDLTNKVTITWTAGSGETNGHRVYRNGSDVSGVVNHGTSTYDDVPSVGTYSYTVKAINAAGLSSASSANNGTRVATNTGLTVANSSHALSSEVPVISDILNVINDYHTLSSDNIILTDLIRSAVPDNTYHESSSTSPTLGQNTLLVVVDCYHDLYTGTIIFDAIELVLVGEQHLVVSDSPSLIQNVTLVVSDCLSSISSDLPIISMYVFESIYKLQVAYDDYEHTVEGNKVYVHRKNKMVEKRTISNTSIYVQKKVEVVRYYI